MRKSITEFIRDFVKEKRVLILLLIALPDFISIVLSAITAYQYRFSGLVFPVKESNTIAQIDYRFILVFVVFAWVFTLVASGTYHFNHANLVVMNLRVAIKKSFTYFFILGFLSFMFKASFSRLVFLIMLISGLFYLFILRITIYGLVLRPMVNRKIVTSFLMIIGRQKKDLEEHSDWLISHRSLGFTIASRLVCTEISTTWLEEFDKLIRYKKITEILLLPGMESDPNFSKFIHYCEDLDLHVNWIPLDSGNLGYWLIPSPQEGIPFLTFEKSGISIPWRIVKRIFDLTFSISLMVLLSPLFIGICLAVLITSGRPIFYSQRRVGRNGRTFKFYKFRTMIKDAEKQLVEVENIHANDHVIFKNRQDPRVTPIGRILRKYSLDELPQFLNVINNSMSVVGPRPALPREVNAYNSIYERRLKAKPGITGPWQISGRSDLDLQTSVALDLNYLTNWSFTRDLWIIVSTIGAVLKGKGAY